MKKGLKRKLAITSVLVLMVFGLVQHVDASGFAVYTQGAGALGQGNSATAHLDSPSAIFLNPALINRLEGTKLELGTTLISPSREFTSDFSNDSEDAESNVNFPSTFFITHKASDQLSFGLGVFNPFGLGNEWDDDWEGRYIATNTELTTFNINPVVSYQVMPNLAIAVGLDVLFLDSTQERKVNLPTVGLILNGANPAPILGDPLYAPSDGKQKFEGDGNGVGYNLGMLFDINEDISFGASYRSEIEIDVTGDASFNLPAGTGVGLVAAFPDSEGGTNITLPQQLHAGIAYSGIDNLIIETGIRWEGWSSYDELKIKLYKAPLGQAPPIKKDWDDTFSYLFGGEYQLNEMVVLRAGYIYADNPVPDDTFEPSIPDSETHIFTLGTGILYKKYKLDLAYAFQNLSDRDKDNTVSDPFNPANDADGEYSTKLHMVGISLTHTF
jgi:long-chain fatty acid transport protein